MAVILGLAVAVTYGAADFLGGLSARRSSAWAVVVFSQLLSVPVVAALVAVGGGRPTATALGLGLAVGTVGGVGLLCLYRGLAAGVMSVVAPVTAVGAAAVPLGFGLARGERPSTLALGGAGLALVSVVLVSRTQEPAPNEGPRARRGAVLGLAVAAGAGFGTAFVLLAETGAESGLWPLATARLASVVLVSGAGLLTSQDILPAGGRALGSVGAAGALDAVANALFLLATRQGLLSVVAVVSSLYPAMTVVLARVVLGERLGPVQVGGVALALAGIGLMAAG